MNQEVASPDAGEKEATENSPVDTQSAGNKGSSKSSRTKGAAKARSAKKGGGSKEEDRLALQAPYAVIRTGGKQYVVTPGSALNVERIEGAVGDTVEITDVLCVKSAKDSPATIGTPIVNGATVKATVVAQSKSKKVIVYKKKRRTGFTKKQGHRQLQTRLRIESISA